MAGARAAPRPARGGTGADAGAGAGLTGAARAAGWQGRMLPDDMMIFARALAAAALDVRGAMDVARALQGGAPAAPAIEAAARRVLARAFKVCPASAPRGRRAGRRRRARKHVGRSQGMLAKMPPPSLPN